MHQERITITQQTSITRGEHVRIQNRVDNEQHGRCWCLTTVASFTPNLQTGFNVSFRCPTQHHVSDQLTEVIHHVQVGRTRYQRFSVNLKPAIEGIDVVRSHAQCSRRIHLQTSFTAIFQIGLLDMVQDVFHTTARLQSIGMELQVLNTIRLNAFLRTHHRTHSSDRRMSISFNIVAHVHAVDLGTILTSIQVFKGTIKCITLHHATGDICSGSHPFRSSFSITHRLQRIGIGHPTQSYLRGRDLHCACLQIQMTVQVKPKLDTQVIVNIDRGSIGARSNQAIQSRSRYTISRSLNAITGSI